MEEKRISEVCRVFSERILQEKLMFFQQQKNEWGKTEGTK